MWELKIIILIICTTIEWKIKENIKFYVIIIITLTYYYDELNHLTILL